MALKLSTIVKVIHKDLISLILKQLKAQFRWRIFYGKRPLRIRLKSLYPPTVLEEFCTVDQGAATEQQNAYH